jgi:hypothetical protein
MIFKKLILQYEGKERTFNFSKKCLIFSKENSVGKSTVLRLLFWALGYPVPGTYKMRFSEVKTSIFFEQDGKKYRVNRNNKQIELLIAGETINSWLLTGRDEEWLAQIWGVSSLHVVRNILGAIYMDQDKGWTLLNRGKVIGNISFNVRDLLIGLQGNEADPDTSLVKLDNMNRTLAQVNQLLKIVNMSEEQEEHESGNYGYQTIDQEYKNLKLKKRVQNKELAELRQQLRSEKIGKRYILSSNIIIKFNGTEIPVTEDNLLNVDDNLEYLREKITMIQKNIELLTFRISSIEEKLTHKTASLFEEDDVVNETMNEISKIPINATFLEVKKRELQKSISKLNESIEKEFLTKNNLIGEAQNWINVFAKILNVQDVIKEKEYIFTRNLKSISGTIYYKIVFCFKMAYIKVMENHLQMKFPIVLDSPSGREVTNRNIQAVIGILNKYFPQNQIIISSINHYKLDGVKELEIDKSIFE